MELIRRIISNNINYKSPKNNGWSLADMHTHPDYWSSKEMNGYGEGFHNIKEMLESNNMDAIAITPHFRMQNVKKVQEYADQQSKLVIHGTELGIKDHTLIYAFGINQYNADHYQKVINHLFTDKQSLDELIKTQNKFNQGTGSVYVIVAPAHFMDNKGVGPKEVIKLKNKLTAIESTNSDCFNTVGLDDFAKRMNAAPIGGSDAHRKEFIGTGGTILYSKNIENQMDVYECIINKKTSTYHTNNDLTKLQKYVNQVSHRYTLYYLMKFVPWLLNKNLISN
jgi:hypothetical protein